MTSGRRWERSGSISEADLILGPLVGGLSSDQAHFWGRASGPATLYVWIGQQPDLGDVRLAGTSLPLAVEDGFAGVAPLRGLSPLTHYRYALTLSRVPPTPDQAPFPKFTTFPEEGKPVSFAFAFGSCFLPEDENEGRIFHTIDRHRQNSDLRFFLMLGDQIYADAFKQNGIGKVAIDLEDYRGVYAYTWSRPHLRRLLANLPVFMTLDDHEVDDDWTWTDPRRRRARIPAWDCFFRWLQGRPSEERRLPLQRVRDVLKAYWEHQGMHAATYISPPHIDDKGQYVLSHGVAGSLAYTFHYGGAAFFILDTLTMRVKGRQSRSMLGEGQWRALEAWLMEVKDSYPVICTLPMLSMPSWMDPKGVLSPYGSFVPLPLSKYPRG